MTETTTEPEGHNDDGVTRRDFIHDVALAGIGAAVGLKAGSLVAAPADAATAPAASAGVYYPPTLTGLRGSHPGAFESAHALAREGVTFPKATASSESYDLVVVGAGISGLAAAYFYRQKYGEDARILLLDNHDDFGGHAKRNEFHQGDRMRLAWGGTVNIEYWSYSDVGLGLLRELGVDLERMLDKLDYNWGDSETGLDAVTWFDRDSFGRDALVPRDVIPYVTADTTREDLEAVPVSSEDREALYALATQRRDVLEGLDDAARERWLHSTSYTDFLQQHAGLSEDAMRLFAQSTVGIWGVRAEHLSVAEALEQGLPGARLLGFNANDALEDEHGPAAMFPDGNATIARLLVRALIPGVFPPVGDASEAEAIVRATADYGELDRADAPVRLRLNATVLHVANSADGVELSYFRDGQMHAVRARRSILACYNRIIPHICPGLPEAQKRGLAQCIKRPMGTVNVVLRDGQAIQRSGISAAHLPGSMLQGVSLVTGIRTDDYEDDWDPRRSCVLHFFFGVGPENPAGMDMVQQSQAGRKRLLEMSFADFEAEVYRVLRGVWGDAGLDPEQDILAITVNRWPHGYARDLMDLEDPAWLASPGPYEVGRRPFGNIAIANSDSGADAYTHTAIDQAWRAVNDLPA
ncbi:MAG: NAD(P)-binding protein [Halieaceae bacterium]|jgi:spermidine dehydrogenase|nr:NAD(P)-binding protein [Halieaceae bacterium]